MDIYDFQKSGVFLFRNLHCSDALRQFFIKYLSRTNIAVYEPRLFMPGSAVLLFYLILKHGSVDFLCPYQLNTKCTR